MEQKRLNKLLLKGSWNASDCCSFLEACFWRQVHEFLIYCCPPLYSGKGVISISCSVISHLQAVPRAAEWPNTAEGQYDHTCAGAVGRFLNCVTVSHSASTNTTNEGSVCRKLTTGCTHFSNNGAENMCMFQKKTILFPCLFYSFFSTIWVFQITSTEMDGRRRTLHEWIHVRCTFKGLIKHLLNWWNWTGEYILTSNCYNSSIWQSGV